MQCETMLPFSQVYCPQCGALSSLLDEPPESGASSPPVEAPLSMYVPPILGLVGVAAGVVGLIWAALRLF
jgi:hypothetical protein